MDEKKKCTLEEYGLITAKIHSLQSDRMNLVEKKINVYRKLLKEAEENLVALDKEIASIKEQQNRMDPVSYNPYETVKLYSKVRVMDLKQKREKTFFIVKGNDPELGCGSISINAPLAQAILGKKICDIISVNVPAGFLYLQILDIMN